MTSHGDLVDAKALAKARTVALLASLGIERVLWVDDQYATQPAASNVEEVVQQAFDDEVLPTLWQRVDELLEVPASIDRDSGDGLAEWLREKWDDLDQTVQERLVRVAERADVLSTELPDDELRSDLRALRIDDLFSDSTIEFTPLRLEEWRNRRAELLADPRPALLLIDRDFSSEGFSTTVGEEVLVDVLTEQSNDHVSAALFTHSVVSEEDERKLTDDLSKAHSIAVGRIVVIGKFRSPNNLPEALRVLLLAEEIESFRALAKEGLEAAHASALQHFDDLHRYTLFGSIAAAAADGGYEFDGPIRIAANTSRRALLAAVREAKARPLLTRFREASIRQAYLQAGEENLQIQSIRRADVFEQAEFLAALSLPVAIGDIFETYPVGPMATAAKPKYWILLAQSCDISIREHGARANQLDALTLTEFRTMPSERVRSRHLPAARVHPVGMFSLHDSAIWGINAAARITVPAAALDATVFSADGSSVLPASLPQSPIPSGWEKRLNKLNDQSAKWMSQYRAMSGLIGGPGNSGADVERAKGHLANSITGGGLTHKTGVMVAIDDGGRIEFGVRRVGGVTHRTAIYLLNLAMGYQGRPANAADIATDRPGADESG